MWMLKREHARVWIMWIYEWKMLQYIDVLLYFIRHYTTVRSTQVLLNNSVKRKEFVIELKTAYLNLTFWTHSLPLSLSLSLSLSVPIFIELNVSKASICFTEEKILFIFNLFFHLEASHSPFLPDCVPDNGAHCMREITYMYMYMYI